MLGFLSVVLYCNVYEPGPMGGGREPTGAGDGAPKTHLGEDYANTLSSNGTLADYESLEVCYDECGFNYLYAL
ncbi:hypothetical protein N7499_001818 [Penicillium canescens]|nr:hypothetical protein N7499_001818 [Penicillium canescens]